MRVLITNDDGPPQPTSSPYIANFVRTLQQNTDWEIVVAIPKQQRSWIGKAHIIGENVSSEVRKYPETGDLEWVLLNGTPASCANIGVTHYGPFDLVISGPNYGRNTSAAYIMGSGTVGASTEAAISGVKSIALSYSYTQLAHPEEEISAASDVALKLVNYLVKHWSTEADVYTVNIPVFEGLSAKTPVKYTHILQNKWRDVFAPSKDDPSTFLWAPNYGKCDETVYAAGPGSDAWTVLHNEISVTPIRAVFQSVNLPENEIIL